MQTISPSSPPFPQIRTFLRNKKGVDEEGVGTKAETSPGCRRSRARSRPSKAAVRGPRSPPRTRAHYQGRRVGLHRKTRDPRGPTSSPGPPQRANLGGRGVAIRDRPPKIKAESMAFRSFAAEISKPTASPPPLRGTASLLPLKIVSSSEVSLEDRCFFFLNYGFDSIHLILD